MNALAPTFELSVRLHDLAHARFCAHPQGLSTGAYGDEGALLLSMEETACAVLQNASSAQDGLAWLQNASVEVGSRSYRVWNEFIECSLGGWRPVRYSLGEGTRQRVKDTLFRRLCWGPGREGFTHLGLFERLAEAVDRADLVEVVRGGAEWQVLHQADVLALLGPYLRELAS